MILSRTFYKRSKSLFMVFLIFSLITISSIGKASLQNDKGYQLKEKSNIDYVALLGAFGGLGGILWGVYTYSKGQKLKKHEILFPLIKEFDENKCMQHAKDLLDDYILKDLRWEHMHGYYSLKNLHRILKNHKREDGIKDLGERDIRKSFDALLDFFCKLEYLKDLKLIEDKEITYFDYYINIVAENDAIKNYINYYKFPLYGKLHPSLSKTDIDSKDISKQL